MGSRARRSRTPCTPSSSGVSQLQREPCACCALRAAALAQLAFEPRASVRPPLRRPRTRGAPAGRSLCRRRSAFRLPLCVGMVTSLEELGLVARQNDRQPTVVLRHVAPHRRGSSMHRRGDRATCMELVRHRAARGRPPRSARRAGTTASSVRALAIVSRLEKSCSGQRFVTRYGDIANLYRRLGP